MVGFGEKVALFWHYVDSQYNKLITIAPGISKNASKSIDCLHKPCRYDKV